MSLIPSNPFRVVISAPSAVPAWQQGMAAWEWRQIPGSALSVYEPTPYPGGNGYANRINAWCGLAASASGKLWSAANGGHNDYAGNEVVQIDLLEDSPVWTPLRGPSTPQTCVSHYADGRPSSRHSYYQSHYVEGRNRIFLVGNGSAVWCPSSGPGGGAFLDAFDLATNDWEPANTWPAVPGGTAISQSCCKDNSTGDLWVISAGTVRRWSQASGEWESKIAANNTHHYSASAIDHTRGNVVWLGGEPGNTPWRYNIVQNQGFSLPNEISGTEHCMDYVPAIDAFVHKTSDAGTVRLIHPVSFAVGTQATSGTSPPDAVNGVCGRFKYIDSLRGFAYYPHYTSGVWFLRTH